VFHAEVRVRRADGQWRWLESWARPRFSEDGTFLGHVGGSADVSDRKRVEADARDADRRKDEFLATLAHELRNPLAPILNASRLLDAPGRSPADEARAKTMIARQAVHMERLVEDLLDLSRVATGKVLLRRERVDLAQVAREALSVGETQVRDARLALHVALPREPVMVDADPVRLAQILSNLIRNACKYTDPGGQVGVSVEARAGEALVRVTDSGIGIATEHLPYVFDMFRQVDAAQPRSQGGLGIGLALSAGLARMHQGRLTASSAGEGQGSTFELRLPLASGRPPADRASTIRTAVPAPLPARVLVVDDNRDSADSLAMLLMLEGVEVRTAYTGKDALDAARRFVPELIVLDLGLPDLEGDEVCRQLRRLAWPRPPLIVALTGRGQASDRRGSAAAGFDAHLVKPVDFDALLEWVRDAAAARG
jgi:signal transduction histidine kinase/ActR/RegA family two-component response regulator